MKITVAICTWNRAVVLGRCLEQLARMQQPCATWELIVVNNGSTDETERVLDGFVGRLPLRHLFEPAPGQSHARNTAVRHAAGDYIIWTDDDVLVPGEWLRAYERALKRWPEAAVFGGPVRPKFEGTPPAWLSANAQEIQAAFAARELGERPFELTDDDRIPWGANFAVRMREQRQFLFDPALGRKHTAGTLGEETAVIRAILRSGSTGWWIPEAAVEHWIPKERQSIDYLRSYYALVGRTYCRWDRHGAPMLWACRPRLWFKTIQAEMAYALARLSGNPRRWVRPLVRASILRGAIKKKP